MAKIKCYDRNQSPLPIKSTCHQLYPVLSNTFLMWSVKQLQKVISFQRIFYIRFIRKEMLCYLSPVSFSPILCFSNTFSHYCKKILFGMEVYDRISSEKLRKSLWKILSTYMMKASLSPSNACDGITFTGRWVNNLKKEEREEGIVRHRVSLFTDCTIMVGRKTKKHKAILFHPQFFVPLESDPLTIHLS